MFVKSRGFAVSRCQPGFSLAELMVSIFILGLIATATVVDLRASQRKDELNTAARVLLSELRSLQDQALTAQNIKTCTGLSGKRITCEQDSIGCSSLGVCASTPPLAIGMHLSSGSSTYAAFAEVDPSLRNGVEDVGDGERIATFDLGRSGSSHVVIQDLLTSSGSGGETNVVFGRQNGSMTINGCSSPCSDPVTLRIRLRHTVSNEIKEVSLNAITGRMSIQ